MTYWKASYVTLLEYSESCTIILKNISRTDSGEHKIMLTSLMMSSEPGFREAYEVCDDCLNRCTGMANFVEIKNFWPCRTLSLEFAENGC